MPVISEENVISFFESNVSEWTLKPFVLQRLVSFGLPSMDCETLLDRFSDDVRAGSLSTPSAYLYYALERFCRPHDSTSVDAIYNTIFFAWASRDENQATIRDKFRIRSATLHHIQRLVKATSRPFPADEHPFARKMHRKIIMHVGPTNSGKTHHALRALAAAKSGVYAGPLRLLAHEIWDRLNTGQIIPLGVDPPSSGSGPTPTRGDPKYARLCNMRTGEEHKVVDPDAKHLSCTVEMLSFYKRIDVAVIDEVQMISDPERGNGWVNAILGLAAHEIHLCGEETAVPVVQALLQHTGDEVIVRRYERLTPLVVEEKSLDGDLTKIREGDCIVTFSRSNIFALKKAVEETTGMRCAVVYGRLPPEVRSEQATLFNDPSSGYDVIIGSDAIGMGLNLYVLSSLIFENIPNRIYSKIKRVIFEATSKFTGSRMQPLSVSSIKQIAGRAGRYGLHSAQADLGGTTTTLYPQDLPHLVKCISTPFTPLSIARVSYTPKLLGTLMSVLPPNPPLHLTITAATYIGRLPPMLRYSLDSSGVSEACAFLDKVWSDSSNDDKTMVLNAPIPWRDVSTTDVIKRLLVMHKRSGSVELMPALKGTGWLETMESLEKDMFLDSQAGSNGTPRPKTTPKTLLHLEGLHKVVVFYVWMRLRNPVIYADTGIDDLKQRLEKALNWGLSSMSNQLARPREVHAPDLASASMKNSTIEEHNHHSPAPPILDVLASPQLPL